MSLDTATPAGPDPRQPGHARKPSPSAVTKGCSAGPAPPAVVNPPGRRSGSARLHPAGDHPHHAGPGPAAAGRQLPGPRRAPAAAAHRRAPVRHRPAGPRPALPRPARRPGLAHHRRAGGAGLRRHRHHPRLGRRLLRRLGGHRGLPHPRSPDVPAAADDAAAGGGPVRPVHPGHHVRDRHRPMARGSPPDPVHGAGGTREAVRLRRPDPGPAPRSRS